MLNNWTYMSSFSYLVICTVSFGALAIETSSFHYINRGFSISAGKFSQQFNTLNSRISEDQWPRKQDFFCMCSIAGLSYVQSCIDVRIILRWVIPIQAYNGAFVSCWLNMQWTPNVLLLIGENICIVSRNDIWSQSVRMNVNLISNVH